MKYVTCNKKFYLRVPYLPVEVYENLLMNENDEKIESFIKREFEENLLSASVDFYNAYQGHEKQLDSKMRESLYKYIIRSSYRTTPFGLLSGILLGEFSETTENIITEPFRRKCRPDLDWIYGLIPKLRKIIGDELLIIKNNTLIINELSVYSVWRSCIETSSMAVTDLVRIDKTNAVKLVLEFCNNYTSIAELKICLSENYPGIDQDVFNAFIYELLEKEVLIDNLRIPLIVDNPFKYLLKILKMYNICHEDLNKLFEIDKKLDKYELTKIGLGLNQFQSIQKAMNEIRPEYVDKNNMIQQDLYNNTTIKLPKDIEEDVSEFADFIYRFALNGYSNNLKYNDFYNKFIDFYGNQCVSVLTLFDLNIGLGIPKPDEEKRNFKILKKIILNGNLKQNEINLADIEDEVKLKGHIPERNFEISFFIFQRNENYYYQISPLGGSEFSYQSLGRFQYIFNQKLVCEKSKIKKVEITYIPQKGHNGNVMNCKPIDDFYLEYSSNSEDELVNYTRIALDDVYIFAQNSRFHFIQKSTGDLLEFYMSSKINPTFAPPIIQMLLNFSNNDKVPIFSINAELDNFFDDFNVIPRICYKSLIIRERKWKLDDKVFMNNGKLLDYERFKSAFCKYQIKYNIPNKFFTVIMDNRLLLNLDKKSHFDLLYHEYKKTPFLILEDVPFENEDLILSDTAGQHFLGEFVFQFSSPTYGSEFIVQYPYHEYSVQKLNDFNIGSEWLSVLLYLRATDIDYFIVKHMLPFLKKYNYDYFYIRYFDNKHHIRLRIKNMSTSIYENITSQFAGYVKLGIISDYKFDTYSREYNRYGGESVIGDVENIFCLHSKMIGELLSASMSDLSVSKHEIFILMIYSMIKDFNMDEKHVEKYLKNFKLSNKEIKDFKQQREKLVEYYLGTESDSLKSIFISVSECNKLFWNKVNTIDDIFAQQSIFMSVLHMDYNRLVEIDRKKENFNYGKFLSFLHSMEGMIRWRKK